MTLNITPHKNILIKILKDIYADTSLGFLLGFKGGTAAYLFYGLDRFSVDLDFDLLDKTREQEVLDKVGGIAQKYGIIKEKSDKRYNLFILLSYSNKAQNVKIEMNKRNFNSHYEVKSYLGISMLVMKQKDMFAHKLVAMTERKKTTSRDIYDVHFFLNDNWEINREIVEKRMDMKLVDYLQKCIKFVENFPDNKILTGLGELLDEKQKVWVKAKLKTDTIFLLKLMLDNKKNEKNIS